MAKNLERDSSNLDDLSPDDILVTAKVGLVALIDEVTGYQEVRPKDDLQKMKKKYEDEAVNKFLK